MHRTVSLEYYKVRSSHAALFPNWQLPDLTMGDPKVQTPQNLPTFKGEFHSKIRVILTATTWTWSISQNPENVFSPQKERLINKSLRPLSSAISLVTAIKTLA